MAWSISNAMMKDYENSNCLRERVEEFSQVDCLGIEPSAQSNTTLMPDQYYWPDKTTEHCRLSRFGMTCEPLTASHGEELLTWFRGAFLVPTSVQQGSAKESAVKQADCGESKQGSFARYDQSLRVWRTAQCSLLGDSDEFSETWPRWGMTRNGAAYLVEVLEPITSAIESGSWLPTPTCHNAKEGAYPSEYKRNTPSLATHVGGKIHPNFTEWMMFWPTDWSDLSALGTDKFRSWLQQHGEFFLANESQ